MATVRSAAQGILADENRETRERIIEMLKKAYWMEIETVMSYIANSINPDGVRAQEIVDSLQQDITEELGHAQQFALSWWEYLGTPDFWNRTLQNWQSEFLAVGSMAIFAVFLRQRGSPESKPVGAPHDATGVEG